MTTRVRTAGLPVILSLFLISVAGANVIPDYRANDEETGQEFQHDVACCVHPDGRWTAAWLDYRAGAPAIFMRTFSSDDAGIGPGQVLTNGLGLFGLDLNASVVGEPAIIALEGDRSLLIWTEVRGEVSLVRAAILDPDGIVHGPVGVNDTSRRNGCRHPHVAATGTRLLAVWEESVGLFARVRGRVLDLDLTPIGAEFPLHPEGEHPQAGPVVATRSGGWLAAWEEGDGTPQVTARAFGLDGAADGGPFSVEAQPSLAQRDIALLSTPDGYFLSWTSTEQNLVRLLGRSIDLNLDPVGTVFDIYQPDAETVTPRAPELIRGSPNSVVVVWPAGAAAHTRLFSREVQLPDTPSGDVRMLEDPADPVEGVLIPRSLAVCGGNGLQRRLVWWDNREGWDLAYSMRLDETGGAVDGSVIPIEMIDGTASQVMPAAAIYPNDKGIVVWEDFRTGGLSIFGRMLDRDGAPEGASFRISEMSTGSVSVPATNLRDLLHNRPSVATTTDGSAAAVWTVFFPDGRSRVYLQSFDPSGERLGGNIGLPTVIPDDPTPNTQLAPTIVGLADGGYMIVWRDTYSDSNGDIFARRFLADGTAAGDTIRIVDPGPYAGASQDMPTAASSGEGEVIIAWIDGRSGDGDVYAQRLGPTGHRVESNLLVSGPEGSRPIPQLNPSVAAAPGRYAIVWDDDPLGIGTISGMLTILPSLKNASSPSSVDIPFHISTGTRGMKYPRVAMNPDGRFVVTYWDTTADSARVMAQRFDPDAGVIGPPYSVGAVGGRALTIPGGVAANGERIQYAFSDSRDMRGWDARVRRVDWTFDGWFSAVAIATWAVEETADALLLRWSVPLDRAGALYTVWREENESDDAGAAPGPDAAPLGSGPIGPIASGGADYLFRDATARSGQRFAYWIEDASGDFAGPWSGSRGASSADVDLRVLGNPFRTSTRLAWSSPRGTRVDVTIHDATGRRVRLLRAVSGPPSGDSGGQRGELVWDGRDDSGRPVPAGAYWARLRATPGTDRSVQMLRLR
jgi:hypothetical protein